MAMAPERIGIGIRRHFTTAGVHPYDEVAWERRDARITNFRDGTVAFEQRDVEVPTFWSQNATNILAQKYFRGQLGSPERETSLKQVADRVADTIADWGEKDGYFVDAAEAAAFRDELKYLIVHQRAAFNSPVWFNIGVKGTKQQASACQPWHAPVSTPEGIVPIGKLVDDKAVGTKVYDSYGVAVILAVKANGIKPVLRVQTTAGPLEVTPDHLVWRSAGSGNGAWAPAGELRPGDRLEWHCTEPFSTERKFGTEVAEVTIERIEDAGAQAVYDIQTDSGEYLSGNIRVHNCFILAVEDTMDAILDWYKEEGIIFKGGSGSGINLSRIRSSKEALKGGGTASGPVSFMRGADASAGTIKSGGTTRRAAKMVILNADHPDIEDFIWCKAIEERKARALRDAGFDMDLDGKDSHSIQYQNANNSVRVTDEFMQAVIDDADWHMRAVTTGQVVETVKARDLFRQIAKAAWECADPGLQYDTTINKWHTAANTGRINASNPCCFVGETEVLTAAGPMRLDEIVDRCDSGDPLPQVRSFDLSSLHHVATSVNKAWVAGYTRSLVEVTLTCGRALRCTPEHRFLTATGAWVQARDLERGQRVRTTDGTRRVRAVEEIELVDEVPVYDLEAVDHHNFAVSLDDGAGVIVHNSEYVHLDNSACNLASINLLRFLREDDSFDTEGYKAAIEVVFTAQEILVGNADYPTPKIDATTRRFRQLGLGYANLGALLMALGLPYDSDGGRAYAAVLTALMTGHAYATSARTAMRMGPFAGYTENREHMNRVLRMHRAAVAEIDEELVPTDVLSAAQEAWDTAVELGEVHGVRNSQSSVLAPTGTISFLLDCDTTGIEPDLGLVKTKKLVGGGTMSIVNQTVPRALRRLGYTPSEVEEIVAYIDEHYSAVGAPHLRSEHLPVFACSMGDLTIHYLGHVKMMAAVQPFISGAISKCITGESLVPTSNGLVRIGSLYDGEAPDTFRHEIVEVASLDGAQKTDAFYYGGRRSVWTVRLRSGHRITGTPNHRVMVAGEGGTLEWKRLDEITLLDSVAVKYGAELWSDMPSSLTGFSRSAPYGRQKRVDFPTEMTQELAFLLGAFASEGHITRSTYTIHITNSVESVLERVAAAWGTEFGLQAKFVRNNGGRCPAVQVSSKSVVEFFDWLGCGTHAADKRIPDSVLASTRSHILAFLQGLALDAYVSVTSMPKWAICLDSSGLLDDLQSVLTNLGVVHSRVSKFNRQYQKSYGEVYATGADAQRLSSIVPFMEPDKAARADVLRRREAPKHDTADVIPWLTPRTLYELLPRAAKRGDGCVRQSFTFLCDPRTKAVSRRSLERVASVPGVALPQHLVTILSENLHFSPVEAARSAGEQEVFDVSVPTTHAFVANGIINHNTVNMPEDVTVEDVEQLHMDAWKLGLKAVAIYRDNCKVAQPLSTTKKDGAEQTPEAHDAELAAKVAQLEAALQRQTVVVKQPMRERLPRRRKSSTFAFRVADCEGYVTVGEYDDGRPGEVFMKVSKQGSTLAGIMDAFSISVSLGLQHGVPLATYVRKYTNMRFEPAGMTDDPDLRIASSLVDYIFRRLAVDYLPYDERAELGILTTGERMQPTLPGIEEESTPSAGIVESPALPEPVRDKVVDVRAAALPDAKDAPYCYQCGNAMQRAGSCYVCTSCGTTSGCS